MQSATPKQWTIDNAQWTIMVEMLTYFNLIQIRFANLFLNCQLSIVHCPLFRFGLFPFRSPLLRESLLISFPPPT